MERPIELEDYTPWRELALAVVWQAAEDYKAALKAFKKFPSTRTVNAVLDFERFFTSDRCDLYLQDITTGAEIIKRARAEAEVTSLEFKEEPDGDI